MAVRLEAPGTACGGRRAAGVLIKDVLYEVSFERMVPPDRGAEASSALPHFIDARPVRFAKPRVQFIRLPRTPKTQGTSGAVSTHLVQFQNEKYQVVRVAAFYAVNDDSRHLILVKRNGDVDQIRVLLHGMPGAQDQISHFPNVGWVAAYSDPDPVDQLQHVIIATADGKTHEIWFGY